MVSKTSLPLADWSVDAIAKAIRAGLFLAPDVEALLEAAEFAYTANKDLPAHQRPSIVHLEDAKERVRLIVSALLFEAKK